MRLVKFVELVLNTGHPKEAPFYAEPARNRKHARKQLFDTRRLERPGRVFR